MKFKLVVLRSSLVFFIASLFFLHKQVPELKKPHLQINANRFSFFKQARETESEESKEGERAEYNEKRLRHEYMMLRNPVTGIIPKNFRETELLAAGRIPGKHGFYDPRITGISGTTVQNSYDNVGPSNVAGRARTLALDRRNPNIMLTGGTTGGIFRTTDGGASWTFVLDENDIRSANTIVQDPKNPDTWYCGTGEVFYPPSASDISHGTFGWGIFKSTNNGITWTKLPITEDNNQHQFNGQYDLVHRLAVHPVTGHVYAALHNRIVRSVDGGQSWELLLGGKVANTIFGGLTELYIPSNGSKIYAAFDGENVDRGSVGVWESATGAVSDWKRIAGGVSGQPDSVAGWQPYGKWGRVVLTMNGANTKLFVFYKNGEDAAASAPKPEADLFRCDVSSGNPATYTWTDLKSYVPNEPNYNFPGIDPYTTQFNGYNMSIAVKPDNDNLLFIGGTAMHRVNLAETTAAKKFRRIGGYGSGFFPQSENFIYPNHHPDVHWIVFSGNDRLFTASDGGIHKTSNSVLADTVRWLKLNSNLQTLQYQTISIAPDTNADFIVGGTQDNGTQLTLNPGSSLEHQQIGGGDGATSAISLFRKTGNTWKQSIFLSVVEGSLYRINLTWVLDQATNNLDLTDSENDEISPTGSTGQGQWLTLFANDPDSTEILYFNNKNKLYRTRNASTVTATGWTELTGVAGTLASDDEISAMALSQRSTGGKYLFFGTASGKIYRLPNANIGAAAVKPVVITPPTMTEGSYVAGISVNPRNPDTVLAVVSNYDGAGAAINNIFWTGNATAAKPSWQIIDNTLAPVSSQSCAIVVKNSGVEYYVGTSVGLYSTTIISGNSTVWFNEGGGMLKKAIVRALVNRQKDNTLVIGTHGNGAFLSRIGNAVNLDVITALPDPVTNDKTFINAVYPTITNTSVQYRIGNLFTIKKISVQVFNLQGQLVYQETRGYQNGTVDMSRLAKGEYILTIYSDDRKYRHIQKILKQ